MVLPRLYFFLLWVGLFSLESSAQQYQLNTLNIYEGFSKGLVKDIVTDDLGMVWLATDEGLVHFDGEGARFYKDELAGGFAKRLLKRQDGSLLVAYDRGVTEIVSRPDTVLFRQLLLGESYHTTERLFYPKSLYETREGELWIGENQAMVRYIEGGIIRKYRFPRADQSDNIFHNFSPAEDSTGRLWVFSFTGNLYHFDPEGNRFVGVELDCDIDEVSALIAVDGNRLWATAHNGVFEIEVAGESVVACRRIPGVDRISCGIRVNQKSIYVGTWDQGLYYYALDRPELGWERLRSLPFDQVVGLSYDHQNGLWVGGNDNIALLTPTFFKTYQFDLAEVPVEAIQVRPDSSLLIGSADQLYRLQKVAGEWEVGDPLDLVDVLPTALYLDADTLWLGTFRGELWRSIGGAVPGDLVDTIPRSSKAITSITKDRRGNLWIAGNGRAGLVQRSPEGRYRFFREGGLRNCRVVLELPNGLVVAAGGYRESYLFYFDPGQDKFIDLSVTFPFPVSKNFVVEDLSTRDGSALLLATSDGLLEYSLSAGKRDESKISRVDLIKVPVDEPVRAITRTNDGTFWIATTSGLLAYNGQQALRFDKNSGLPSNNLTYRGLQLDYEQNLWVATSTGLALFRKNSVNDNFTPQPLLRSLRVDKRVVDYTVGADELKIPYQAPLEINFQSLSYPTNKLRYQTRILEVNEQWSEPGTAPYTLLSGLPGGRYTFQVRAQQQGGYRWSSPQSLAFRVTRPWYHSGWAIISLFVVILGIFYALARLYNWTLIQQNARLEGIIRERTAEIKAQQTELIEQKNQIIEQNERFRILKEQQLQQEIDYQDKRLTTYTLHLMQKNEALKELRQKIFSSLRSKDRAKISPAELNSFLSLIDFSFHKDREWENFKLYFEKVHVGFFENLKQQYPELSLLELRHCALIRLNLSISETATILGISAESVKTARFRMRKKMTLASQPEMIEAIMRI